MEGSGLMQRLIKEITDLADEYKKQVSKPNKVENIWKERLELGKSILEWTVRKYKISFKGEPQVVKKRYIFYCELGFNIGSEQKGKRPVVILQNDKGNSSSPTTIVAPITTHRSMKIIGQTSNGKIKIELVNDDGAKRQKVLDYYEIPIEIEPGYKKEIIGYINLAQIRTVSKKRLEKSHVAMITEDAYEDIAVGFNKLLAFEIK